MRPAFAFALGAGVLAALQTPSASRAQPNDTVADGRRAYMAANCYQCHGTVGHGGVGPRLAPKPMPFEALNAFVRHSARSMPAYDARVLSDADLRRIHVYLSAIDESPPPVPIDPTLK